MITKNFRLRCDICGKMMPFTSSYYEWAPYGQSNAIEPPDNEHAHKRCFEDIKTDFGDLIEKTSYIKPYFVNNIRYERRKKLLSLFNQKKKVK